MQLDEARLVIDFDRGLIALGLLDVVGVNHIAEDRHRIGPAQTDRRAGEARPQRVRQRLGQIAREAFFEAILRAMRFIGNQDEVAARGQLGMIDLAGPQAEFFDGGEDDGAAFGLQEIAQVIDIIGLLDVAHQRSGRQKLIGQLIVEIRPIDFDHEDGIVQIGMAAQNADEEDHRQGFAGAGGVPDHANAPIGLRGPIGRQRFIDRETHRKELMILGAFLGDLVVGDFEDDEIADVEQQPIGREQALEQRLHAAGGRRLNIEAIDRFPRRVPFGGGGPHTCAHGVCAVRCAVQQVDAIGHDDERVEVEELRDVVGVVLNLIERVVDKTLFLHAQSST